MAEGANVDDLELFRIVKAALLRFRSVADTALLNGDGQIGRVRSWLEGEQLAYWQTQIRKQTEAVARAKDAIRQKQLFKDSSGRTPSAFHEEKALQAAIQMLAHAETRLANTRKSVPLLEKESEAYRGAVQGLGSILVSDFPKAIATLERMAAMLDEYVTLSSRISTAGEAGNAAGPAEVSGNMGRGGESSDEAVPPPASEEKGEDRVDG